MHGTPSRTQTQITTVKNLYFPIKAELSFKKQVISLMRGCGAEMQGQGLTHSLLQAKSYWSLRVMHAEQVLHHLQGAAQPQLVPSCHHKEQGGRNK